MIKLTTSGLVERHAPAPVLPRRDPVLVGLVAVLSAFTLAAGTDAVSTATLGQVNWLLFVPFHIGVAVFAYQVAQTADAPRGVRRFWRALSLAAVCYLIGDALQLPFVLTDPVGHFPGTPAQTAVMHIGTIMLVIVMLTAPLGLRTPAERTRFWLDTATIMVATAGFGVYFTVPPDAAPVSSANLLVWMHDVLLGPVLFLIGVFAVVKLVFGGASPFTRRSAMLIGAAAAIQGTAEGLQPSLVVTWPRLLMVLNVVANGLLMASARVQQQQIKADPTLLGEPPRRRPYSLVPYVAIAATYALLVAALASGGLDGRAWGVLGAAIASTALVVVRQLAAFADNARLLTQLDAKVQALNRTEDVLRASLRERDDLAAELRHLAFHDSLTGLPNRALFTDRVESALARARRRGGEVVILLIDLDDFKPVNDRLGHASGDELLREVGRRLQRCVREADTSARLGGDEFALLLEEPVTDGFVNVARRVVRAMQAPCNLDGQQVVVRASVGVAVDRGGAHESGELLREADVAMYAAKQRGKGNYQVFAPASVTSARRRA